MPFENRYVGFIDILGFRGLVSDAASDAGRFETLQRVLLTIATEIPDLGGEDDDFRVTSFSDCIAVSARTTDTGLWMVILYCNSMQFNFWPQGILFRGAITKGAMHHSREVLFGPAFVAAYDLEIKIATHPRIMLAAPVYQDAIDSEQRDFPNYVDNYRLSLPYDVPCINPFASYEKAMALDAAHGRKTFTDARSVTVQKLQQAEGDPPVLLKWEWLARVYNDLIDRLGKTTLPGIHRIPY
jgi:hypothetical protein